MIILYYDKTSHEYFLSAGISLHTVELKTEKMVSNSATYTSGEVVLLPSKRYKCTCHGVPPPCYTCTFSLHQSPPPYNGAFEFSNKKEEKREIEESDSEQSGVRPKFLKSQRVVDRSIRKDGCRFRGYVVDSHDRQSSTSIGRGNDIAIRADPAMESVVSSSNSREVSNTSTVVDTGASEVTIVRYSNEDLARERLASITAFRVDYDRIINPVDRGTVEEAATTSNSSENKTDNNNLSVDEFEIYPGVRRETLTSVTAFRRESETKNSNSSAIVEESPINGEVATNADDQRVPSAIERSCIGERMRTESESASVELMDKLDRILPEGNPDTSSLDLQQTYDQTNDIQNSVNHPLMNSRAFSDEIGTFIDELAGDIIEEGMHAGNNESSEAQSGNTDETSTPLPPLMVIPK